MSDDLLKALGKVFDVGHSHFFCYFPYGYGRGLQKDKGHMHFVMQYILVQCEACIFQNDGVEMVFVIVKLFCNVFIAQGQMIMTVNVLQNLIHFV